MKAKSLKRTFATAALAILTVATPAFAQTGGGSYSGTGTSADGAQTRMDEPAGADRNTNWSWIGLLGLLGLFGLKRRHETHDETYRAARA